MNTLLIRISQPSSLPSEKANILKRLTKALVFDRTSQSLLVFLFFLLFLIGGSASAQTTYIYTDPQGTKLAEADSSGAITGAYDYKPYGQQILGAPVNGPAFTGHVSDPESSLTYMQQRYYDSEIGRFISTDPLWLSPKTGENFNRFWYASANPFSNWDPDGRCDGPSTCAIDRDIEALNRGEMTRDEFMERSEARAAGAVAGVAIVITGRALTLVGAAGVKYVASRIAVANRSSTQQNAITKINNIIKDHAKPHDFEGVRKELQGISTGFDHVTEMRNSLQGLRTALKSLEGSLKNPSLSNARRADLTNQVTKAKEVIQKMEDALSGN